MNITGVVRVSAACCFVLALGLGPVRAATFYVAKDGRDADPGSEAKPWATGRHGVGALAGTTVRFRFHLQKGKLYAFWVSPDASGASRGYVAAGGSGFTGPTDTVGAAAPGLH